MREEAGNAHKIWHIAGLLLLLEACSLYCWHNPFFWRAYSGTGVTGSERWIYMGVLTSAYIATAYISGRIVMLPRCGRSVSVLLGVVPAFTVAIVVLFLLRTYYSRSYTVMAFFFSSVWIYVGYRLFFSSEQVIYGFTPGSDIKELRDVWKKNFIMIESPESAQKYDIMVVAPHTEQPISANWNKYITNMMIQGVPMAHPGMVYEFFTGRMPIEYMTEGPGAVFRPKRWYPYLKRIMDLTLVALFAIPAVVAILLISACALLSSGAPIFFVQERTGKNARPYRMYKFRSMTEDGQVTGIGRILRKYRLDEIPQFWNVLRGEMSFIGPRPEVPALVARYSEQIPFYSYRTSMLPGITGWAQVNYGYAAVTSENKVKLGYDLYYIKHASFALDILILVKTARTIFKGFGV